jgi:hypothetical protein
LNFFYFFNNKIKKSNKIAQKSDYYCKFATNKTQTIKQYEKKDFDIRNAARLHHGMEQGSGTAQTHRGNRCRPDEMGLPILLL